jgi:two-component system response regulator YesN
MSPFEGAALIMDVFSELGKSVSTQATSNPNNMLIRKASALVNSRLDEKTSVAQIARTLHVSREHLSRVFKKGTGNSLKQYILQRKIKMACKLLKETNLSIKEISTRLGFTDQRGFCRTFQNHTNITPRDFRKSELTTIL